MKILNNIKIPYMPIFIRIILSVIAVITITVGIGFYILIIPNPLINKTIFIKSLDPSKQLPPSYTGKVKSVDGAWITAKIISTSPDKKTLYLETDSILSGLTIKTVVSLDEQTSYLDHNCNFSPCVAKAIDAQRWWQNYNNCPARDGKVSLACWDTGCNKIKSIN